MSGGPARVVAAVVPAAGLGTRLSPLTLGCAKELLPLGRYPALVATLLEASAAAIEELVIVGSPQKPGLHRFIDSLCHPSVSAPSLVPTELRALVAGRRLTVVEQPAPVGALDAVERGLLALTATGHRDQAVAVLFPDLVQLPDQTALVRLVAGYAECRQALFGLRRAVENEPPTSTVAVQLEAKLSEGELDSALRRGQPLRIVALGPARGVAGELLTTFGQIQSPAMSAAIEAHCRRQPGAPLEDRYLAAALASLATSGGLYGVLIPGEIIDLGSLPSYLAASRRFLDGGAKLRGLP
jgi:UTP-glucose-1-phosphate uridylyltransferase